jgi:predicted secreted Zn-dependent protease
MVPRFPFVTVASLLLGYLLSGPVLANPTVKTNWGSYTVNGTTAEALLSQMRRKGPNGFWAYTRWYVRWTGSCRVSLEINYTMPRHTNRGGMPANLRQQWDRMIAALKAHEEQHGAHGINAARELVQKRCKNGDAVLPP